MGSYRAKNVSISELLKAHARGILPGVLKVDQGNREAILRALNNWGWDDSLKLYLPFNETAGQTAFDLSGNGNTGTATGTTIVDGVFGKARDFDGLDDYVDCGNGASLDITDAITVEAWVKPELTGEDLQVIVDRWDEDVYGYSIRISTSKEINVWLGGSGGHNGGYTTGVVLTPNEWQLIGFTYNRSTLTVWRNGVSVGTQQFTDQMGLAANTFIAKRGAGGICYFNGLIDEVRIYSRVLTADEIYLHYLAGALKLGVI